MQTWSALLLCVFLFINLEVHSTKWITIGNGNWSDSSTWQGGLIPPYSNSDTILIRDTVYFHEDLFLNTGSFMHIDSLGGALCGHQIVTVFSGAVLEKFGALSLDTLNILGGHAEIIVGGFFLMFKTHVSNGGSLHAVSNISNCWCAWDTCFIPRPRIQPPEEPVIITQYSLFPNPSNGNFSMQYTQVNETTFYFYDLLGQLIFSKVLENTSGLLNFNYNLGKGIYYWKIMSGDSVLQSGKQMIIN